MNGWCGPLPSACVGTTSTTRAICSGDMTAAAGSPTGVGGTVTSPAPTRARAERERADEPVRREPAAVRTLGGTGPATDPTRAIVPAAPEPPAAAAPLEADGGGTFPEGAVAGGATYFVPHVSQ